MEVTREKGKVTTEEKYFRRRIQQKDTIEDVMHEGSSSVGDIQRDISNIKELRKCYLELNIPIENVFGEEYQKEILEIYNQLDKYMNDFVRVLNPAKKRI